MNILRIRNEMRNGKTIFDLPLRVTFYARVSTDNDEQLNSLKNQIQYYTELIQLKPNWTYIEELHLDIHLKFDGPYGVVFNRENSSFRFNRS